MWLSVCVYEDLYSYVSVHMSCAMHDYLCAWDMNVCLCVCIRIWMHAYLCAWGHGYKRICVLNCKMFSLTQLIWWLLLGLIVYFSLLLPATCFGSILFEPSSGWSIIYLRRWYMQLSVLLSIARSRVIYLKCWD